MFRMIVVPFDGSPLAERAIPYARDLAAAGNGKVLVVTVIEARHAVGRDEPDAEGVAAAIRAGGVDAEACLYYLPAGGEVGETIAAAARDRGGDLIVQCTRGRSGITRMLFGSVADQVLRRATVPVLLIPPSGDAADPARSGRRILAALDGSTLSEEILGPAGRLADAWGADLLLARVAEPLVKADASGTPLVNVGLDAQLEEARVYLARIAADLRATGREVRWRTGTGAPAQFLTDLARDDGADVIALATHGRGGLARAVMGSIATEILRRTRVPLLVVRPAALGAALEPAAQPAATAAASGALIEVSLSAADLDLIRTSLTTLTQSAWAAQNPVHPVRDLVTRLDHARSVLEQRGAAGGEGSPAGGDPRA